MRVYWSLWKEHWVHFGPFGRTTTTLDEALRIVVEASIFWVST
jgi:hypothetical protein